MVSNGDPIVLISYRSGRVLCFIDKKGGWGVGEEGGGAVEAYVFFSAVHQIVCPFPCET